MDVLQRLRQSTRTLHDRVEKRVDLLRPDLTRLEYLELLERFHGFYAPLEEMLTARLEGDGTLSHCFRRRRKTSLLLRDLEALGSRPQSRAPAPPGALPRVETLSAALGCLYVLEGATLGGRVISRHVGPLLGVSRDQGCSFFESYGEQVSSYWQEFRELLRARLQYEPEIEEAVGGACETFIKFEQWLTVSKFEYD